MEQNNGRGKTPKTQKEVRKTFPTLTDVSLRMLFRTPPPTISL